MKYNPKSKLSSKEIDSLSDDELFEYLDGKAKHLKKFSAPLDTFHAKRFATMSKGKPLTDDEMRVAKEIGRIGDDYETERMVQILNKKGNGKSKRTRN